MFIFNFKPNLNKAFKISLICMIVIVFFILFFTIHKIFFSRNKVTDRMGNSTIIEITPENYTNILKTVNENIDSYIGLKVHFTGYVYRLLDFEDDEFVLARDMIVSTDNQMLIVGFLCKSKDANNFEDGTWVDVTGEITKKRYHKDIAMIKVSNIFKVDKPSSEKEYVYPPDNTYIPTSSIF